MKISGNEGFQPVTIVIETQGEADLLAAILGAASGGSREGDMVYKIYCALDRDDRKYKADGYVRIQEA